MSFQTIKELRGAYVTQTGDKPEGDKYIMWLEMRLTQRNSEYIKLLRKTDAEKARLMRRKLDDAFKGDGNVENNPDIAEA